MQFFRFVKESSDILYVLLNSVITNVVAFNIVVTEMALSDISYIFSIFPEKLSLPAEKKFSSATQGTSVYNHVSYKVKLRYMS